MVDKRLAGKKQDTSATRPPWSGSKTTGGQASQDDKIIIAVTPEEEIWNEGVIGLVAGKISDKYYLPTLVITKGEDGYRGSGRSIEEFNIIEAIGGCAELLERYGGHPAACGFSLAEKNLERFKEKITEITNKKLSREVGIDLKPKIKIEAELKLNEINEELISTINKFAPFGQANERPKFISRGVMIVDIINMGIDGQHIKLRIIPQTGPCSAVADNELRTTNTIFAIGFGQAEKWQELRIGDKIDIVYYVEMNEFNGRSEVQMKIVDIKRCGVIDNIQ
jgi:single-stranded-DNA-specific exonuclease